MHPFVFTGKYMGNWTISKHRLQTMPLCFLHPNVVSLDVSFNMLLATCITYHPLDWPPWRIYNETDIRIPPPDPYICQIHSGDCYTRVKLFQYHEPTTSNDGRLHEEYTALAQALDLDHHSRASCVPNDNFVLRDDPLVVPQDPYLWSLEKETTSAGCLRRGIVEGVIDCWKRECINQHWRPNILPRAPVPSANMEVESDCAVRQPYLHHVQIKSSGIWEVLSPATIL